MKLRNKRTGEIKDVESLGHENSLKEKYGPQITLSWNTEYESLGECRTYNSLAEINEEWEDYEEPKPQVVYYIDRDGGIVPYKNVEYPKRVFDTERNREIGNYFETKEEAEKAVEKLKAWKRLKDKGLKFKGISRDWDKIEFDVDIKNLDDPVIKDLDLLFGGKK